MKKYIVTSEQVGRGHPDKLCDQIADLILMAYLEKDKNSRVAIETTAGKKVFFITGEVSSKADISSGEIITKIEKLIKSIDDQYINSEIIWNVGVQSPEINSKVDGQKELGAGDQGLMYGYATNETPNRLAIPHYFSNELIKRYELLIQTDSFFKTNLKFDSKAQVSFDYESKKIINVNMSVQHSKDLSIEKLREVIFEQVVMPVLETNKSLINFESKEEYKSKSTINNAGTFISGGAIADAGTVGRKIIADSYGGFGRHGGGAFSGKDYTKVDRSGAYYARYVARKIVDAGYADICEIQVAYIIGFAKPISVLIECFGTNKIDMEKIENYVNTNFDFSVSNIINELDLKNIDYTKTTIHCHFGKDYLPWK